MAQSKDSQDKPLAVPETLGFTVKQRLNLLANLITDKMIEDQKNGFPLLKKITAEQKYSQALHITINTKSNR